MVKPPFNITMGDIITTVSSTRDFEHYHRLFQGDIYLFVLQQFMVDKGLYWRFVSAMLTLR